MILDPLLRRERFDVQHESSSTSVSSVSLGKVTFGRLRALSYTPTDIE